jgi:hypothetical protein
MKNKGMPKLGFGTIALGAIALCAIVLLIPRLFGGDDSADVEPQSVPQRSEPANDNTADMGDVDLGDLVVATGVDRDGCPTNEVSTLRNVDEFYVVAPNSEVAEGTDIFARLYLDETAVEDVPLITADSDYQNTCINFVFERTDNSNFESGDYEVEFWVNGNAYDSITFRVQ